MSGTKNNESKKWNAYGSIASIEFQSIHIDVVPANIFIILSTLIKTILSARFAVVITLRIESSIDSER